MKLEIERNRIDQVLTAYFGLLDKLPPPAFKDGKKYPGFILDNTGALKQAPVTLPSLLKELTDEMTGLGLMLAGGAIHSIMTGKNVSDLDFYYRGDSYDAQGKAVEFFKKWFPVEPSITRNAYTFKRKSIASKKVWTAQLITRFTGAPSVIFSTFDFTVTQGLFDFRTNDWFFGERFFQDIAARKLVYLGSSRYPICAMYRTKKYADKGYSVPGSTIMHIALSIVQLDIKNYGQLKDQLMGIDTMYLQNLLGQDRYSDDLPVDYGKFLVEAFEALDGIKEETKDFESLWEDDAAD